MSQSERLQQEFDITPERGIELQPLPQMEEGGEGEEAEEVKAEVPESDGDGEAENHQSDDAEITDEQSVENETWPGMDIKQFASEVGLTMPEVFHGIRLSDGRTLSESVDETRALRANFDRLQTENSQLKEQLSKAQTSFVPMDDPEALALEKEAEVYQKALDNADWSQVDPGVAANQKLEYMRVISQLKDAAKAKRTENATKQRDAQMTALMAANQELLKHIPEWNSAEIYARDNRAMGDFLTSEGFTNEDLSIFDTYPVAKKFMYKAWKAMAKQKEIERGAKKVRKISKSLSPGGVGKSTKTSLKEAGKAIRQGKTATERSRARLSVEFDR